LPLTENLFDARIARVYDSTWADLAEDSVVDPAVDFLAELAGSGAALELGIGTGRLALPLSARGIAVHGIDLCDLMARLAGMTLRERWADWQREPFTSESTTHVSLWEKVRAPDGSAGSAP
jgi:methylase of polypeptide subunit release factors